jgi:hypothetical protein
VGNLNGLAAVSMQLVVIIMTGRKPIEWPSLLNLSCKFKAIIKDCIIWPFMGKKFEENLAREAALRKNHHQGEEKWL